MDTLWMLPFRPDCTTIEADIQPGSTYSVDLGPSVHMLLCQSQGHISCHHVAEVQEVEAELCLNEVETQAALIQQAEHRKRKQDERVATEARQRKQCTPAPVPQTSPDTSCQF